MKKFLALFLSVIMALSVFAGCNQTDAPQQTGGDTVAQDSSEIKYLRMTNPKLDSTLSRFQSGNQSSSYVTPLIWDRLVEFDTVKQEYVPALAEKMERNADATTLTFILKDAKWHDGEPVTAKDVVMSVSQFIKRRGAAKGQNLKGYKEFTAGEADTLAGIVEKDSKTVVFEFDGPNYLFHENLATMYCIILPYHILGGKTMEEVDKDDYWVKPIGTGPYMVNEVNYPSYITLTRFDEYHGGKAGVKDILVNIYEDTAGKINAMMAGELDIYDGMPEADADSIVTANAKAKKYVIASSSPRYLQFNLSEVEGAREDLKNQKIRQALSMIIDRQAVVDYIGDQATLATTNNLVDYNTDIPQWKRNLEEGKRILQEEGFDFSTPLRLYSDYTDQQSSDVRDIIVASLKEAGIDCTVTVDKANNIEIIYTRRDWDLLYSGQGGLATDTYSCLAASNVCKSWFTPELQEVCKQTYGKLIEDFSMTADPEERQEYVDKLQVQLVEDAYHLPIWHRGFCWTINEDFTGFVPYADQYKNIARVDVTNWKLAD